VSATSASACFPTMGTRPSCWRRADTAMRVAPEAEPAVGLRAGRDPYDPARLALW
jgi:hypothetical protein